MEQHGPQAMLSVVIENTMRNAREWQGELGAALGSKIYVDMCSDDADDLASKVDRLYADVQDTLAHMAMLYARIDDSTECFFTHDWGLDLYGRNNHARVKTINTYLQNKGVATWFDDDKMCGDLRTTTAAGIDNTKVIIVFVTNNYRHKVNGVDGRDNCKYGA